MATAAAHSVNAALEGLLKRVAASSARYSKPEPRVVAVSKTKPAELVRAAYDSGQRHFGENYVQELEEKAKHPQFSNLEDIRWHFIGHLQRNKCNRIVAVPNLWMIETVDSDRLATSLDNSWHHKYCSHHCVSSRLRVMVQVNTSREEAKHGCHPEAAVDLVRHIQSTCKHLEFSGLMTIGAFGREPSHDTNPDFAVLVKLREDVCRNLGLETKQVELSMGMSADFDEAIAAGSTNIRIGRTIFGDRPPT